MPEKELYVASDGELAASSGVILTEAERKELRLERDMDTRDEPQRSTARSKLNADRQTVRPGNPIYLQVIDADQDISNRRDAVFVDLETASGDTIDAFKLEETEAHSGIFRGQVATGKPAPKASASDSATGSNPGDVINSSTNKAWQSLADGRTPKWFEVDLQNSYPVKDIVVTFGQTNAVRAVDLLGAHFHNDYRRLARFGGRTPRYNGGLFTQVAHGEVGLDEASIRLRMTEGVAQETYLPTAGFIRSGNPDLPAEANVVMAGKFFLTEKRSLTLRERTENGGAEAIVYIDGERVNVEEDDRGRLRATQTYNVTLARGLHDMEVLLHTRGNAVQWRLEHLDEEGRWKLLPRSWFSPQEHAELYVAREPEASIDMLGDEMLASIKNGERYRKLRFVFREYVGDSLEIEGITVKDEERKQLLPVKADFSRMTGNNTLEMGAGDRITATYRDQKRLGEDQPVLSQQLDSSYFDAEVTLNLEVVQNLRDRRMVTLHPVKRVTWGNDLVVQVTDWDRDVSNDRDRLEFQVEASGMDAPMRIEALENGPHTGVFEATLKVVEEASERPNEVVLQEGAKVRVRYFDEENAEPGYGTYRSYEVFEAGDDRPEFVVLNTSSRMESVVPEREDVLGSRREQQAAQREVLRRRIVARMPEDAGATGSQSRRVSMNAPVLFFVRQPSAALSELSRVTVQAWSQSAARAAEQTGGELRKRELELDLQPISELTGTYGFGNVNFVGVPNEELVAAGLFAGVLRLQLGSPGDEVDESVVNSGGLLATRDRQVPTIVVQGGDTVYLSPAYEGETVSQPVELYSDGEVHFLDRQRETAVEAFYLGQELFLQVTDLDLDRSDDYDYAEVRLSGGKGDELSLKLKETLPHSGVFDGVVKPVFRPRGEVPNTEDEAFSVQFGEEVTLSYRDENHAAGVQPVQRGATVRVYEGSDGQVNTFSKRFKDEDIAVRTAFTIAEAYFELAKEHRELGKTELSQDEIATGKRLLQEALNNYPDTEYAAQAEYLLANLAQEYGEYNKAIQKYSDILNFWPDSEYAPKAQFKLGLCYEKMDPPNEPKAIEEYVKITYKYPDHPLVADVIIRLGQYFWRNNNYGVAGDVFASFQERFNDHQLASRAMLLSGQAYIKDKQFPRAAEVLTALVENYRDDNRVRPEAMYWLADAYEKQNNLQKAYQTFKTLTWDYPTGIWAKRARAHLVESQYSRME